MSGDIDYCGDVKEDEITTLKLAWFGFAMVALGIISAFATYKYIVPIGSIFLIVSGLIMIFRKRWIIKKC